MRCRAPSPPRWTCRSSAGTCSRRASRTWPPARSCSSSTTASTSGATFGTAITLVGALSAQVRAGRVDDALRGFRDVVEYFARAGNWTHLWTALRNLADLLRALGDPGPAALLDAAADAAPDAPPPPGGRTPVDDAPGRAEALATARAAIARHLHPAAQAATKHSPRTHSV